MLRFYKTAAYKAFSTIDQPLGFMDTKFPYYVCWLNKSLYGLNKNLMFGIKYLVSSLLPLQKYEETKH